MSSSPEAKGRATRGQKRNFSFESHPTSSNLNPTIDPRPASGEGDRFDIASLVSSIERTIEGGAEVVEQQQEYAGLEQEEERFIPNDGGNVVDDAMFQRGNFVPFTSQNPEAFSPVDLQVSNLDQSIDQREMKKVLYAIFSEHVNVLNVSVFFQSDGNMAACVRVGSPQEAQIAIAQLHRKKLGFKRILISNNQMNNFNPNMLRSKVGALLAEVPSGRLQLFKFREMYEKRYHESIGVSDLYKMKDVVSVTEDVSGRMIQLQPNWYYAASQQQRLPSLDFSMPMAPAVVRGQTMMDTGMAVVLQNGLQPAAANGGGLLESAFCEVHCADTDNGKVGWAEKENGTLLPTVNVSLAVLSPNVKQLIQSHGGTLPLASVTACYAAVFPPGLQVDNDDGVPLEHLVSCVRGVAIQQSASGIKQIIFVGVTPPHQGFIGTTYTERNEEGKISSVFSNFRPLSGSSIASSASSSASSSLTNLTNFGLGPQPTAAAPLAGQLALFSRELVDLLKTSPGCRMPFSKFIPAYHHHFGRQCRVADYGYTKLKELFEALPHVVQIMGDGSKTVITLAHRAQVKRFTNDLLKVLKAQPSKQLSILDLPVCFEKAFTRIFKITDYGVCDMEDILHEVSETTVVLSGSGDDMVVAIPKREQTQTEVERTQLFAQECVELLRHAPDCRLNFNKFIPAYHHHFGRQCRVSDYGFSKLIELFEAIPMTVEITEDADGERILQLTDSERLAVLADQITILIVQNCNSANFNNNNNNNAGSKSNKQSIKLDDLEEAYIKQFGYQLRPDTYGENSVVALLGKLSQSLRVEKDDNEVLQVRLIDRSYIKALAGQVRDILATDKEGKMDVKQFGRLFEEKYGAVPDLAQMRKDLIDWVEFVAAESSSSAKSDKPLIDLCDDEADKNPEKKEPDAATAAATNEKAEKDAGPVETIRLKPLQLCVVKIQSLLKEYQDKILMSDFEAAFAEKYKTALCPGQYGYPSLLALIQSPVMMEEHFLIRGRGARKMIWYMRDGHGPALSLASLPTTGPVQRSSSSMIDQASFQDRVTSAINSFTSQNRYPLFRQDPGRSAAPGGPRGWSGPNSGSLLGRPGPQPGQYQRQLRAGPFQPLQPQFQQANGRNRFVYPPPAQSQFMNYPMSGMQGLIHQPPELTNSYWGNLAQFGLYPNGRGGVAPATNVGLAAPMDQPLLRPQNLAVGSTVYGRAGGSMIPPPPLPIGSPISQSGISSMLPTPLSPSPMMAPGTSPFMFPPTYWPGNLASSPGPFGFK